MSTAYMRGAHVAHVMTFDVDGSWRSLCSTGLTWDPNKWWDEHRGESVDVIPLKFVHRDGPPPVRWCSRCTARVRELAHNVLGPELISAGGG